MKIVISNITKPFLPRGSKESIESEIKDIQVYSDLANTIQSYLMRQEGFNCKIRIQEDDS